MNTSADQYRNAISKGTLICDWRGTVTGTNFAVDATANNPSGSAVVSIAGDSTVDTATGATGNATVNQAITALATGNLKTLGVWAKVPARNIARKNYRNVPIKVYFAFDNTFSKYLLTGFNARADGRWHFYQLDVASMSNTGFTIGTDTIGYIRMRASVDLGVSDTATIGTAPLRAGETAYFGGIVANAKPKAMMMIRFDDGLANLYSSKAYTFSSPYVGQSGVTVPTGSYSAFDLVSLFGFKAACFILTRYLGSGISSFETVAGLQSLQSAGWEICWQTHYNPVAVSNAGARLLGPSGSPWYASATINHATDGTITTPTAHDIVAIASNQTVPIKAFGTPPSPLLSGLTYWVRQASTTTFKLFNTEADALANTNAITFASAGSATWGYNYGYSATDNSMVLAEFAAGVAAMQANGFAGWMHWAPNQGAIDSMLEDAAISSGIKTVFTTDLQVASSGGYGPAAQAPAALGMGGNIGIITPITTSMSAFATDAVGALESQARAYVQKIATNGGIGSNFHHTATAANALVLAAYLDELKLRSDANEIEVATPTRIAQYVANVRLDG